MRLILASSSPYRQELLKRLGLPFDVVPPEVDESPLRGESPMALALRLARAKAVEVSQRNPEGIVIGSDQVATFAGRPIGKPGSHDAAAKQLRELSGRSVDFHTALCVTDGKQIDVDNVITTCRFRQLSDAEIEQYLQREQPYDTAGSAKAEGLGIALMDAIESDDPTAIIGLPLISLSRMLRSFGVNPLLMAAGANA